jgi:hypothetical protein
MRWKASKSHVLALTSARHKMHAEGVKKAINWRHTNMGCFGDEIRLQVFERDFVSHVSVLEQRDVCLSRELLSDYLECGKVALCLAELIGCVGRVYPEVRVDHVAEFSK